MGVLRSYPVVGGLRAGNPSHRSPCLTLDIQLVDNIFGQNVRNAVDRHHGMPSLGPRCNLGNGHAANLACSVAVREISQAIFISIF